MPDGLASVSGLTTASLRGCAPPRGFRSAEGVRSARFTEGPFGRTPSNSGTAAQRAGKRYEEKVLSLMQECFLSFRRSPWIEYVDEAGYRRFCQPDGLIEGEAPVIFEVKIRGTSDAYFQLHRLYRPVVERALGRRVKALVQVCRSFDPMTPYPEPPKHLDDFSLEKILAIPEGNWGVLQWRL